MKWITEISIENYRGFSRKEKIYIPFGNHLLIYGENGSGKSSIYNALKDFFISSNDNAKYLELNHFEKLNNNTSGKIEVIITDSNKNPTPYVFSEPPSSSNHYNVQEILLANKVKGFLDYKRLLNTYFLEVAKNKNPNLFDLLVEDILAEHLIEPISIGGVKSIELSKQWQAIKNPLQKETYDGRTNASKDAEANLSLFEDKLKNLLLTVFLKFKDYIRDYFDSKLEIDVNITKLTFDYNQVVINRGIFLNIKYSGQSIPPYQHFLNEARLSALASCIYLAALKTYPIDDTFEIRPIFLDDVFIGLDTNNRIPLLNLLHNEFIKHNYQIFISTYDRHWFELSKQWFTENKIKVQNLEMFTESDDNPLTPDKPILLPSEGLLEKAEAHFKAKDYPAAGNYLRKECENIIWNLLPETYRVDVNGSQLQGLEILIQQLEKLYEDSLHPFPQQLISSLKIYRKIILNPTSHSDLESPLFRREINDAFRLVKELKTIPKIIRSMILAKDDILLIEFPSHSYSMEVTSSNNIFSCVIDSVKTLSESPLKFYIKKWTMSGTDFGILISGVVNRMPQTQIDQIIEQKRELSEIFDGICNTLSITMPMDLESLVIVNPTLTLKDLIA